MGLEVFTLAVIICIALIAGYATKRHFDNASKRLANDSELEHLRLERESAEFKDLDRRLEQLNEQFNQYRLRH